jgi:CRISPR-associated protein Csb2
MGRTLLLSVRFHDGRYHGMGDWPPSPARLFQALVAGAAHGGNLPSEAAEALQWLEGLSAPVIAAPAAYQGQSLRTFVPNNDLDAVAGDPARVGEIRAAKTIRPRHFDADLPFMYAWAFDAAADAERHAKAICEIATRLYQLGRGVDMAWGRGEIFDEDEAGARLRNYRGAVLRPGKAGKGQPLPCPHQGSLESLASRFAANRQRFRTVGTGRKAGLLFSQAPKPEFREVAYDSPSAFLLYEIRNPDEDKFAPRPLAKIVELTEKIRNQAADRLKKALPDSTALVDRVFVGRNSKQADKAQRIRITPLPSIGHAQAARSIRRLLVEVPPDCPLAAADIAWAFSGTAIDVDPDSGEVTSAATLVATDDRTMLDDHYGMKPGRASRLWRTVTPAALSEGAGRRRIDPARMREQAKGGKERLQEHAAAEKALRQALRQAGITTPAQSIRVQREPFEARGKRAEAFAAGTRFAKERLWHAEIAFAEPVAGPLLIGDGRYLGLGLMAPAPRAEGVLAFAIADGLAQRADPPVLTRALRRAVMARVQAQLGSRTELTPFFTGHENGGSPARSGRHEHLAFVFDAPRRRLIVLAPHVLERRHPWKDERNALAILDAALQDFRELRAGPAGRLSLEPTCIDVETDPLFAAARAWKSQTPYRVTRHAKANAASALAADLLAECRRGKLPQTDIEVVDVFGRKGLGLSGRAKLVFRAAVKGPILIGRDRHFGGGLFVPTG